MSQQPLSPSRKEKALALFQAGQFAQARALYEKICEVDAGDADSWLMLGVVCSQLGDITKAESCFRKVIEARPSDIRAHYNLAAALKLQGRLEGAAASYRETLRINPEFVEAHNGLGLLELASGKLQEAIISFRAAIRIKPAFAEAHYNLGTALHQQGNLAEAEGCYRAALAVNPNHAEAYHNLGLVLYAQERAEEAVTNYQAALRLKPNLAEAWLNLGLAWYDMGKLGEAAAHYQQALRIRPDYAEAHNNLGLVQAEQNRPAQAMASYREALRLRPDYAEAHNNLGFVHDNLNDLDEAIACYRNALRCKPGLEATHRRILFLTNYMNGLSPEEIFQEHRRWGEAYNGLVNSPRFTQDPDPARRLRVGYVSPDFCAHSVSFFFEPILAERDPQSVEIFCYAELAESKYDAVTARLQAASDHWYNTCGKSDLEVTEKIRADGIDILVDLAGHTAGNRLGAFAHKPAPVQISYLGYPNTTGLSAMDYRLTDAWADPPGHEAYYLEELIRLPEGFLCYSPPENCPAVVSPPVESVGYVTFGSFNNLKKVTPEVIACWSEILRAVPDARLILKNRAMHETEMRERYYALFARHGVERSRIELLGWLPTRADHFASYSRVDIALDSFPYNGTTTTCEALWMGVPVLTLAGDRHATRVGTSLLQCIGLAELVARDPEDYVKRAVRLANDLKWLAEIRSGLRERMRTSTLCDGKTFARKLETVYRGLWRRWRERHDLAGASAS